MYAPYKIMIFLIGTDFNLNLEMLLSSYKNWYYCLFSVNRRNTFLKTHQTFLFCSAHEEWGFCQAGTSAILTEDQTALIGAPGPYTWRGTVFAYSVEDDYLFRDKTHYHIPVREGEAPVDKYAYLGKQL